MLKRALWLGLLLVATQLSTGCWCGYNRPFLFRRCCWGPAGCGFAGGCGTCCSAPEAGAVGLEYGAPPMAPAGPSMPPATPLTRR